MTPRKIHELSTNLRAIAKILGKHQGTVQRWLAHYRDGGIKGILEFWMSLGRKRIIPDWAVASLEKQLEEPSGGFQRYTQIQNWLNELLGVQAEYPSSVSRGDKHL